MLRKVENTTLILTLLFVAAYAGLTMATGRRQYEFGPTVSDANQVAADTIDTDAIVDDAVTAAKIADANVLAAALAADSVITAKIADANVTAAKLAADAVTLAKMADGTAIGDMLWWTGTDWEHFDANEPNNILRLNDSNQPAWTSEAVTTVNNIKNDIIYNVKLKKSSSFSDNDIITVDTASNGFTGHTIQEVLESIFPTSGTDPDVDSTAEIGRDTDGANEPNDYVLRVTDTGGDTQYAIAQVHKTITVPINDPDGITAWTGRADTAAPIWFNSTGMTFTIVEIYAVADTDDYDFNLFESNSATDFSDENDTLIDLVECETDGTEGYTDTETTISHAAIEHDHAIIFSHSATDAGGVIISIKGYFNADVD